MKKQIREEIRGTIAQMPVVDHHEHAWRAFCADQVQEYDLPSFLYQSYLQSDLRSAGFTEPPGFLQYLDSETQVDPRGEEKAWETIRPYLDMVRAGAYFRYLLRGLRLLFDVREEQLFSEDWRDVSAQIREYSRRGKGQGPGICDRMKVTATVLDSKLSAAGIGDLEAGGHDLVNVARLENFIHEERGLAETLTIHDTTDLDQWLDAFDRSFQSCLDAGAGGFKTGLAYNRRIEFGDPPKDTVWRVFRRGVLQAAPEEKTAFQDYMMNHWCRLCSQADVPLQIHTGIQSGTGHLLEDSRPTLLTSLFRRHGDLRVDLFHGGYPWTTHAGLMAKYFPNVYVDGCWLHHISPSAYRAALTSWIETVPLNKIFAWGGDHVLLEQSWASLLMAKDLVSEVLSDLVERDYFDCELALEAARRILHDNGREFWRLGSSMSCEVEGAN
jgi:hypothetical protein